MNISQSPRPLIQPLSLLVVLSTGLFVSASQSQAQTFTFIQSTPGTPVRQLSGSFSGDPSRAGPDDTVFDALEDLDSFSVLSICNVLNDTSCDGSVFTPISTDPGFFNGIQLSEVTPTTDLESFFFDPNDSSTFRFTTVQFFDSPTTTCPESFAGGVESTQCQIVIDNAGDIEGVANLQGRITKILDLGSSTNTSSINITQAAELVLTEETPEIPEGDTIWGTLLAVVLGAFFAKFMAKNQPRNNR